MQQHYPLVLRHPRTLVFSLILVGLSLLLPPVWSAAAQNAISVTSFTLLNAVADQPIAAFDPLLDGATLDLSSLPTRQLNIRANLSAGAVGSVRFFLDGAPYSTENSAPYALAGNNGADYMSWIPAVGAHTLTATPYSGSNGTGSPGPSLTIAFSVTDPATAPLSVTSFTLINADSDLPIAGFDPLPAGATLDLATLPTRQLNIRANTNPATVGSLAFTYDLATFRIENTAPYALNSDSGGNYAAWTPSLGVHTLSATPYSSANVSGAAGSGLSQSFTVIDSLLTPTPTSSATPTATVQAATQTAIAQTQTAIAQTQTAIAQTPTATATDTAATQTATVQAATSTALAQTATALALTPTSTSSATATLTSTPVSPTITPTPPTVSPNFRRYLPSIFH